MDALFVIRDVTSHKCGKTIGHMYVSLVVLPSLIFHPSQIDKFRMKPVLYDMSLTVIICVMPVANYPTCMYANLALSTVYCKPSHMLCRLTWYYSLKTKQEIALVTKPTPYVHGMLYPCKFY